QATTDATGGYSFISLPMAVYTVRQVLPTGWTQTAGLASYTIAVSSGTNSLSNNFGDFQPGTVNNNGIIDAAWLAAQGSGPYILSQANTTYKLMTDVDVPGTAFIIGAANVTLD